MAQKISDNLLLTFLTSFILLNHFCCGETSQYLSVREEQPPNVYVGKIGDGMANAVPPFETFEETQDFNIDKTTGEIRTSKSLDRETKENYALVFLSGSGAIIQVYINVTDMNDHAPYFPNGSKSLSLSETTPQGTKVIVGSVVDRDIGQNGIQDAVIISGNEDDHFILRKKMSGNSWLNLELETKGVLDFESKPVYNLVIRVTDGGDPPKYGDVRVTVIIIDANDNPPQFIHTKYSIRVNESIAVGTSIARVEATDQDSEENARITYTLDHRLNPEQHFAVDPVTGIVRVNKPLDYETTQKYELSVLATDNGSQPLSSSARIEVIVENINEKPATINLVFLTTSNQSAKIAENATYGTLVVRISVSDPDHPNEYFSNINVSLQGDLGHFGLKTDDRVIYYIYVKHYLDRETVSKYDLNVIAVDSGNQPLHASSSFTLWVEDVNDNGPIFTQSQYLAEISEQSAVGTPVTKVSASDKDEGLNAKVTYKILDTPDSNSDWFKIDSNTGFISTRVDKTDCELNALPRIAVVATDSGVPPFSSTAVVLVTIKDVNDMEPEFHQSFYKTAVKENAAQGFCFLQVSAYDPDCNGNSQVSYHLANMSHSSIDVFNIGPTSGRLCVAKTLDYETQKIYEFPVYATDSGGLDSSVIVSITIEDVNDNHPQFYPLNYSTNVNVNLRPGQDIITVQARDEDSGNFSAIQYSIAGGNDDNLFSVDRYSGKVTLINALPQTEKRYILQISALDGGGLSASQPATINISVTGANSHPPVFNQATYRFSVEEIVPIGTTVGSVSATVPSAGNSPDILYTIASGNIDNFFTINQQTGEIKTRVSRLQHHLYPSVLLEVKAEAGILPVYGSAQVNITISDVNDHAPQFISTSIEITVFEDQDLTTTIYMAHATDDDSGPNGTVHYGLSVNPQNTFAINTISGEIRLRTALDYENKTEYVIIVNAFDQGIPSLNSNLTLKVKVSNVNDNPPIFTKLEYLQDVKETTAMDTGILEVTAMDADNDQVTYTLLHEDSGMFGIHGGSGQSGYIYLRSELDRETRDTYTFTVQARDNGKQKIRSATAKVKITVTDANDNNPIFSQSAYVFKIQENNGGSTVVGKVTATDRDIGNNSKLEYSIIDQVSDFSINPFLGEISTTKTLDREFLKDKDYQLKFSVQVVDHGNPPRSHISHVTVKVEDVNDNPPKILNQLPLEEFVDENRMKGTVVIKILADDPDNAENGTVMFMFDPASDQESLRNFEIHPTTGLITTAEVLDYESRMVYMLKIIARDNGNPQRENKTDITIRVRDDNDETPIFPSENKTFEILENTPVGSVIATVKAFDKDSGENGRVSYYLVEGNVFGLFSVNISTGEIYCVREIDYEESSSHTIGIKAIDNGIYNPKSSVISVLIKVIDLNDNPPEFEFDPVVMKKRENLPVGQIVYQFTATDSDSGDNGTVYYSLKDQNPNLDLLELESRTGTLRVKKNIDYETVHQISMVVEAHDGCPTDGCREKTAVSVWLFIEDENDNSPIFNSYAPINIKENEAVGYRIIYVVATDLDSGINGHVMYSIAGGNDEGKFQINSQSGLLSIQSALDREEKSQYILNLMARDEGVTPRTAYTSLTIKVVDVNDNKPVFQKSTYSGVVTENNGGGDFILVISATDQDTGDNSKLTYSLPKGVANDRFVLDPITGHLTATGTLDREEQSSYLLTAFVQDHGNPSLYETTTIIVNVQDQNDNSPVFEESQITIDIPENAGQQSLQKILAHDKDYGDNGKIFYTIDAGNTGNAFEIDSETGELTCNSLDREAVSRYNLTIGARDQGQTSRKATCLVIVHVLDVNDNAPSFAKDSYGHNIPEDIAVGSTVLLVSAMDIDQGDNAKVTYSLGNDTEGQFQINSVSGEIITSRLFDHERKSSYTFNVVAKDGGGNKFSSNVVVTITIDDINDNAPVFTQFPYSKNIASSSSSNSLVTTVTARDADSGDNGRVTYSLVQNTNYFRITADSGNIFINSNLPSDKKLYNLRVLATDSGSTRKTSTGVVLVTVGSPSTSGLRFKQQQYTTSLNEHSPQTSEVQTVEAEHYGGGLGGTITYSIVSGNEGQTFSINSQGVISVKNPQTLDYEKERRMEVVASATDGVLYAYTTVWVELIDKNDNSPQFAQNQYYASVQEHSSMGAYVTQVLATDLDDGRNANITYNIINGNVREAFTIEPIYSGIVKVKYGGDYEIQKKYELTIEAKDGGISPRSSECRLTIDITDINDQPPNFPLTQPINVSEGRAVGSLVAMITANDRDNPVLQYDFARQGNPGNTFTMDRFSGKIRLAKQLDHESRKHYALELVVTDGPNKDPTVSTTLEINVTDENDNNPVFTQSSYHATLAELSAVGTVLSVDINATDADSGTNAQIVYSILNDDTASFSINPQSGQMKTTQEIVFNSANQIITVTVKAQDSGSPPRSSTVAVKVNITQVNQSPPVFESANYTSVVSESERTGYSVLQVGISGSGHIIDYSIVSGLDNKFRINQKTGIISVNGDLDREKKDKYTLQVSAVVRGSPPQTTSTNVNIFIGDVNDIVPEFSQADYGITLPEDYNTGQVFMSVSAKDTDAGSNAEISYSITSGNDDGIFEINPDNGNLNIGSPLDYETRTSHKLVICAKDCKQCTNSIRLSGYASVQINVTDINDNGPHFPQPFYFLTVKEKEPNMTLVSEVHANDKDAGHFGILTYQIDSDKNHDQFFHVDPKNGNIYTKRNFDYENLPFLQTGSHNYELTIIATDVGGRYTSAPVVIKIADVDEFSPEFFSDKFVFSVPGNAKPNTVIGQVNATDKDGGDAGRIFYTLSENNDNLDYFGINMTTGLVYVKLGFNDNPQNRRKRSVGLDLRQKRSLDSDLVTLVVKASSAVEDAKKTTAVLEIQIDQSCSGCTLLPQTQPEEGVSTTVIIIIVLVIIVIISLIIVVLVVVRYRSRKVPPVAQVYEGDFNDAFDFPASSPKAREAYNYKEHMITTPDVSEQSHHSASSGRGSVEADEDDEVMRINSQSVLNSSSGYRSKNMPDSGLPDDDNLSEPSVQNSKDYLAKLGIDTTVTNKKSKPMEHYCDEGGGDNESINISEIDYSKFGPINDISYSESGKDMGFHEIEPQHEGTVSNVINSEEEYSGSYNWDYLLNWGPQYQPLAHVFVEIARLKDDSIQPKKQPVQTVPQRTINSSLNPQVKMVPPPIITNAPPTSVPQPIRSSHGSSKSKRTNNNMTTSFQNMPRSPIAHESSFTSPALTPSFTPSLSPLATRSPEPSYNGQNMQNMVHSHQNTNRGMQNRGRHHGSGQVILSHDPEEELRI
ncbi:protocadherin-16/23 [Mytilus galloprovincialis]|uniref:Protocadherin-16/23 n=1 Tax=Mytilus galloprovincialis TaxID=29158 RepID=A0A8B6BIL4_MYTGA|nr:protocadherin-16/23 [Mytilus galloprovincialis]